MSNEELVPLFIPALGTLLVSKEDMKGSPLDEDEVLAIRDGACAGHASRSLTDKRRTHLVTACLKFTPVGRVAIDRTTPVVSHQ